MQNIFTEQQGKVVFPSSSHVSGGKCDRMATNNNPSALLCCRPEHLNARNPRLKNRAHLGFEPVFEFGVINVDSRRCRQFVKRSINPRVHTE